MLDPFLSNGLISTLVGKLLDGFFLGKHGRAATQPLRELLKHDIPATSQDTARARSCLSFLDDMFADASWHPQPPLLLGVGCLAFIVFLPQGYSPFMDIALMVNVFTSCAVRRNTQVWHEYVPSNMNLADEPSRGVFDNMERLHARRVPFRFPDLRYWNSWSTAATAAATAAATSSSAEASVRGGVELPSGGRHSGARARTPAVLAARRAKQRALKAKQRLASSQLP